MLTFGDKIKKMIDTIYFWILFVFVCIIAIAPATIFYIAFFNDENNDAGAASYLMPLSALLLGLIPVVGGNVLPVDILNLSFWIAGGIIGATLFLIFIFHVKRNSHYLFSTLLTFGILGTLWFTHTNMRLKHDLPYYGNFSFAIPESLYSIWLPLAVILAFFALMLRRKEINYVEVPKDTKQTRTVNIENSFGNVLMRKSIEELTERLAEQNESIESHLQYLMFELNQFKNSSKEGNSNDTYTNNDKNVYEHLQLLSSKIDSLLDNEEIKSPVNNPSHSNIMLVRELTHFIATPLANIEANLDLLKTYFSSRKIDKNLSNYLERMKTGVTISKGILETYREIFLCSKRDDKCGLRELILNSFELYKERENKNLKLNTNIQDTYHSYSNYFIMSLILPILSNAVTASHEKSTVELIESKGVIRISNTYVDEIDIDCLETDGFSSKPDHYGLGLYTVRHLLSTRRLGKLKCYKQGNRIYFEIPIK